MMMEGPSAIQAIEEARQAQSQPPELLVEAQVFVAAAPGDK